MLDCWLVKKNYFQINALLELVIVEQKRNTHVLKKKVTKKAISEIVREIDS